jgi:hypothetical protein
MSDIGIGSLMAQLMTSVLQILQGIVGGLVGGFVSPYFVERLKAKAEKKRKRVEKIEELVAAVSEHYECIAERRYDTFFLNTTDLHTPRPRTKIETIRSVYFPEFKFPEAPDVDPLKNWPEHRQQVLAELQRFARRERLL